ncbi:MAG: hypothetical protein SF029_14430 [bacterium]|nr:hypothetical protein [bacterium]
MYAPPQSFKNLVGNLTDVLGSLEKATLMVYVELTLFLAEQLQLGSEPLAVGWVLLSQMPLYHPQLKRLTPQQRRMQANAASIVPLSSRYAWESALMRYGKEDYIPAHLRLYALPPTPLHKGMISLCRQSPDPDPLRSAYYEAILTEQLPFEKRPQRYPKANEVYRVRTRGEDGETHTGRVKVTPQMIRMVEANTHTTWFEGKPARTVLNISLPDLLPTAQFLDDCERRLGGRIHWVRDLHQLRLRRVSRLHGEMHLGEVNADALILNGAVHLPGMVSAGKTTLAKLIIAHCLRLELDTRITLVVGDTNSAIEIAHQVNSWFCESPADDAVVAVPLLGASQREVHLGRLLASRHYRRSLEKDEPHWGERWLMPVCPLAAHIEWEGISDVQFPAGSEPCERLMDEPRKGRPKRHLCPLFSICPSKQIYWDMPAATVWVTTPGALAQAALPLHLDNRIIKIGDLVYEQCDLVILDEVETIMDWYDRMFSQEEALSNGVDGLLDRLDTQISAYWSANRVLPGAERLWVSTVRDAVKALSGVLTALANPKQERITKNWVKRGYFTPNQLAYRLARRLAGLKEWDSPDLPLAQRHENERLTQELFSVFDDLLNWPPDPMRRQIPNLPSLGAVDELARLMQTMNNLPDDIGEADLFQQCRDWIVRWYPAVEEKLTTLRQQLEHSTEQFDQEYAEKQLDRSVDELAGRLQFTLLVVLLDRHMHIIIHEWYNKPESLDVQQPFSRIPRGMQRILPLPLTGRQYGFVIQTGKYNQDAVNRLGLFSYTNIGRSYLLNFHHLRQDFEGEPGPHVLALSGTSYLPESTPFHVSLPPGGVLLPPPQTAQAINDSRFIWRFFSNERGKPIKISGVDNKEAMLRQLVNAMLADGGVPGGLLGSVLAWLESQGQQNPDQWQDRARLLLLTNSYSQAKAVASALRDGWRDTAESIFHLKRNRDEDFQIERPHGNQLQRMDIEQFANYENGRILVAPMQSIGRGFNILNNLPEPKAAFGAVFFLTRPMNVPHVRETIAQELNRYALQWAEDADFPAWQEDTLYQRAIKARERAALLTHAIERRRSYSELENNPELRMYPRRDLAATTAGRIVQAVGRLLRGGVPFHAYFIDAAWSPNLAQTGDIDHIESEETSLLTALINVMEAYTFDDVIAKHLYGDLSEALTATVNRDNN